MANEMNVTRFEAKSRDSPDEVREPNKTRVEVVRLSDATLGRFGASSWSRDGGGQNASNLWSALKAARCLTLVTWYPAALRTEDTCPRDVIHDPPGS
jgi:hypothetical protein